MASKIQIKRGLQSNLPALDVGELGFTTDQKRTYIGSASGNVELAKQSDVTAQLAEKATKGQIVASDLKIAANADRLKLANLSDEVIQAIAGTAPVNVTPAANSVTTEKVADLAVTPEKTSFIDNRVSYEIEIGNLSGGQKIEFNASRLRTKNMIENPNGLTIVRKNNNIMFGVSRFINGVYDGVDSGWLDVNSFAVEKGKSIMFNVIKKDGSLFTTEQINAITSDIVVKSNFRSASHFELQENIQLVSNLESELKDAFYVVEPLESSRFEFGSITGNTPSVFLRTRVRLKEFIQLKKGDKIIFNKDASVYSYGVSISNLNGVWNGVDYGWRYDSEFALPQDGLVKLTIRYNDNRTMTDSEFNTITTDALNVPTTLRKKVEYVAAQVTSKDVDAEKKEAIGSILVEYGRVSGASYVFVRIPKTLNNGKRIFPRVALTSSDGSLTGTKKPTLQYARDNDTIFSVNAGLFNITTFEPEGQLIIDGVSRKNTPMTSDNGVPIHPDECYPLAIMNNGELRTYPRNANTADMIADGVKHAVTAWGKLVDNYQIAQTDIDNEIVHGEKRYIRQSIGQYQNGDYCVCTVDLTRGPVENEAGLYYEELAQIFVDKGVKFAYSLDGGGSAQTVLGKRQLNPIYEGTDGRRVPTVITFDII